MKTKSDKNNDDLKQLVIQFGDLQPENILNFKKGDRLIEEGEKSNECYFIKKGEVRILIKDPMTLTEKEIAIRSENTFIGEIAFLNSKTPRTASVEVMSNNATFICLRKKDLSDSFPFRSKPKKSLLKFLETLAKKRITETENFMRQL